MARKVIRNVFKFNGFLGSLKIASRGIAYLFLYHRNMRIVFMLAILALLLGIHFKLQGIALVTLCITVTLVFMAEIFNSAIEMLMNMLSEKYSVRIKLVKDIAAAVVLLTALNALAVGYIIFVRRIIK
mgnify:CR=1 FL=1